MVRKKSVNFLAVFIALAVILAMPITANADTVYDGNISTTYLDIFKDIAKNIDVNSDYVFFRSGQYSYIMYVGDIEYNGDYFSGDNLTVYSITWENASGYNTSYTYMVYNSGFILMPDGGLVYSNLGNFPSLIERGDTLEIAQIILLLVGLCVYLLRSIFSFCLRNRG